LLFLNQHNKVEIQAATPSVTPNSLIIKDSMTQKDPKSNGNKVAAVSMDTANVDPNTVAKASPFKTLVSPDCVLYRFAPEIRKLVFKAAIDIFFDKYPDRANINYYPKQLQNIGFFFAGLARSDLPGLEVALFLDTQLHMEFTTSRVESSYLTMVSEVKWNRRELEYFSDVESFRKAHETLWPRIETVFPMVRRFAHVVTYNVE
jgi:hypothetical protein